jgi:cob(I)alamin adenosyltransferase
MAVATAPNRPGILPPPFGPYPTRVKIYTRRGDDGTTGLLYGGRVTKDDLVTEAYGTTDELVAVLGLARALSGDQGLKEEILRIQRELFVVGADLATNPDEREKLEPGVSLVTSEMTDRLEAEIDRRVAERPLPQEFIVPGGNEVSAVLDVARSVCRRAERRAVQLSRGNEDANQEVVRYLNRLSDYLFVLARGAAAGTAEAGSRA